MRSELIEIKLTNEQRDNLAHYGGGVDARLFRLYINGEPTGLFVPKQAVGGGSLKHKGYTNIRWENVWNVYYNKEKIETIIGKTI